MKSGVRFLIGVFLFSLIPLLLCTDKGTGDSPEETLDLIKPTGCEVYYAGDTVSIIWEYKDSEDTHFSTVVRLSTDSGVTFSNLFQNSVAHTTPVSDTFWIIPEDSALFTENAKLEISHASKTDLRDVTLLNFSIRSGEETLVLLTPQGGEAFSVGDSLFISWEYRKWVGVKQYMTVPEISVNGGKTFIELFTKSVRHETDYADTFWVVPDDPAYLSEEVQVGVYNYQKVLLVDKSGNCSIKQ